nr:unnamed protein product [Callosobruchus analis]
MLPNAEDVSDFDSEDDLPLSRFIKRQKVSRPKKKQTEELPWIKTDITPNMPSWTPPYGPKQEISPVESFFFFDDDVINMLVTYTNLYAKTNNRLGDVTTDEMRCFIGILLLSGYNCVPRREMYWENSGDTNNKLVCKAMSRNRFRHIMQNIYCCDNQNLNQEDRFSKIRPLIEILNNKFLDLAPLEEHHCDVTRRSNLLVENRFVGLIRFGQLYIEWFEPYQGSKTKLSEKYKELGLGANVVLQFADRLHSVKDNLNYHIFFDNLFTSLPLLLELKSRGLKGTGTIRENRLPKNCPIKSADKLRKEQRGSLDFASSVNNELTVCKWHDSKHC